MNVWIFCFISIGLAASVIPDLPNDKFLYSLTFPAGNRPIRNRNGQIIGTGWTDVKEANMFPSGALGPVVQLQPKSTSSENDIKDRLARSRAALGIKFNKPEEDDVIRVEAPENIAQNPDLRPIKIIPTTHWAFESEPTDSSCIKINSNEAGATSIEIYGVSPDAQYTPIKDIGWIFYPDNSNCNLGLSGIARSTSQEIPLSQAQARLSFETIPGGIPVGSSFRLFVDLAAAKRILDPRTVYYTVPPGTTARFQDIGRLNDWAPSNSLSSQRFPLISTDTKPFEQKILPITKLVDLAKTGEAAPGGIPGMNRDQLADYAAAFLGEPNKDQMPWRYNFPDVALTETIAGLDLDPQNKVDLLSYRDPTGHTLPEAIDIAQKLNDLIENWKSRQTQEALTQLLATPASLTPAQEAAVAWLNRQTLPFPRTIPEAVQGVVLDLPGANQASQPQARVNPSGRVPRPVFRPRPPVDATSGIGQNSASGGVVPVGSQFQSNVQAPSNILNQGENVVSPAQNEAVIGQPSTGQIQSGSESSQRSPTVSNLDDSEGSEEILNEGNEIEEIIPANFPTQNGNPGLPEVASDENESVRISSTISDLDESLSGSEPMSPVTFYGQAPSEEPSDIRSVQSEVEDISPEIIFDEDETGQTSTGQDQSGTIVTPISQIRIASEAAPDIGRVGETIRIPTSQSEAELGQPSLSRPQSVVSDPTSLSSNRGTQPFNWPAGLTEDFLNQLTGPGVNSASRLDDSTISENTRRRYLDQYRLGAESEDLLQRYAKLFSILPAQDRAFEALAGVPKDKRINLRPTSSPAQSLTRTQGNPGSN